jgi:hypothetical protein
MARIRPAVHFPLAVRPLPAHNIVMSDVKPRVEFEPVDTRTGAGWQVRASLPSGKQVFIGSFNNEVEAREWIVRKSDAWLHLKVCEANRVG